MFHNFKRPGTLVVSALVLWQAASASDLPRLSFNDLIDQSEVVASGTITRAWADWDPDHKYIWTHYELAVSATHKGVAARTADIAEPGGELNGMGMAISGAASYRVGENVLVFLSRMPNGYLRTTGFGQGKYVVDSNGRLHGTTMLKTSEAATQGGAATPAIRTLEGMTVSQIVQLVGARVRVRGGSAQ
jgi:hypothetical protein